MRVIPILRGPVFIVKLFAVPKKETLEANKLPAIDIANIVSILCKREEARMIEAEICPGHVDMLVEM